ENLRTELAKSSGQPLDYFDVALQTARFDQGAEEPFVKYLSSLFAGRELDLVVTLGGPAARFTQKYRGQLFPGRPVLLAAVDQRHVQSTLLTTNDAVVTVRHEPRLLIEDI